MATSNSEGFKSCARTVAKVLTAKSSVCSRLRLEEICSASRAAASVADVVSGIGSVVEVVEVEEEEEDFWLSRSIWA